jgi:hypothetical protein
MNKETDEETARDGKKDANPGAQATPPSGLTSTGLKVLVLLAVQNCSKNLVMRYAVQVK